MIVREIVQALGLQVVAGHAALDKEITDGYCADMLSCVMSRAKNGNVWLTLQAHLNVIAVATMLDLGAVVITEGAPIADDVIAKANSENVVLLATPRTTFWVVGELTKLGIKAQE